MKRIIVLISLVFVSVVAWRIADRLSADAVGMAVGVLFGVLAGVPAALFVLAAGRRRETDAETERYGNMGGPRGRRMDPYGYGPYGNGQLIPPPVIVVTANGTPGQHATAGWEGSPSRMLPVNDAVDVRQFKVVGEKEEWLDEW